ncbi:MAG TPA: dipeptidase [Bacteroidales bacterium]|nr:dipeptidase [Bacteroidales bacterium]HRT83050.1 dipeptidase [Bacteroidales bacterium]
MCKFIFSKLFLLLLIVIPSQLFSQAREALGDSYYTTKADKIHEKIVTIDTHNDSALKLNNSARRNSGSNQVTFSMMEKGGLDAAFFAIYTGQGPRDEESVKDADFYASDQLLRFRNYVESSDQAGFAYNAHDILYNKGRGQRSVILALENGYPFGKDISQVERFYNYGVRAVTLCHNYNNDICDASMDTVVEHNGLSPFGYKVVEEMNRLGIIIDVSHASSKTLSDVLRVSKLPVIASHSGVYAIKNHKRNLTDDEIKAIAAKGGLIQVATGRYFLSDKPKEEVTVKDIADHIDYVKSLVGIRHVGIGTDFDGGGGVVGMENAAKMKNLTVELLKRGYTNRELKMFWGKNILRVLRAHSK